VRAHGRACELVNAGRVQSAERLIDAVWGVDAPETARAQIHAAVTAIRRVLRGGGAAELLETRPEGYVALPREAERRRLDQAVFSAHATEGRRLAANGHPEAAAAELRAGLALWRGEALSGVRAEYVADHRARLEETTEDLDRTGRDDWRMPPLETLTRPAMATQGGDGRAPRLPARRDGPGDRQDRRGGPHPVNDPAWSAPPPRTRPEAALTR
jgi:hypothetical protein